MVLPNEVYLKMKNDNLPFVSVIIPVYNNNQGLIRAFEGISCQDYPASRFEVIVIDNGSDTSPESIAKDNCATYIEEHHHLNSPYSARNRGFEISKGDVLVLLDTTCKPSSSWLSEGVRAISEGADLVGGDVVFDISETSSASEIYDSISNIKMKESIENRAVAKTTNLFFKREVLDDIGWFPEGLRSGGDVRWTYRAVKAGKKLVFSEGASAVILPRGFAPLANKQYRVAKGMPEIWREQKSLPQNIIKKVALGWAPPNIFRINREVDELGQRLSINKKVAVFFVAYFLRLTTAAGATVGLFRKI